MSEKERPGLDLLLNLLADEVAARLQARSEGRSVAPERLPEDVSPIHPVLPVPETTPAVVPEPHPEPLAELGREPLEGPDSEPEPELPTEPSPEPGSEPTPECVSNPGVNTIQHTAAWLGRLALGIFVIVVLINIPINAQGTALARSIPNSASLVIANGLVVKEATSPDIWVYRDGAFHWITSLEAFDHLGYRWQDVHLVEAGFLSQFEKGRPLHLLLKCGRSPNIYALEAGRKRWIVDIPTFEAEGYVWKDVTFVSCDYLSNLPDGESIPPGRGSPPSP